MTAINLSQEEESIVLLAPTGQDAEMAAAVFAREGWTSAVCATFDSLLSELDRPRGALLVAAEALSAASMPLLKDVLRDQPDWSDLPIVLLTTGSASRSGLQPLDLFGGIGNVTLLERPIHVLTLVSTMRAALRARRRQYQVRDLLEQREEARRDAFEANQTKDHFLAALSHELRTPLTPVLLTIAALKQEPKLPEAVRADLALVHRNVELEARLIDDLLDLTRISRGKLSLNREVADLHELLSHTLKICCSSEVMAKALQIDVIMDAEEHHILGDPARVQQVLWNVINNATKFTPLNGHVTVATRNAGEALVEVAVTDTGIGIAPEAMPRIFDAFAQGDSSITRRFGGLGLGLAISKAIVDLHGGSLRVESGGMGRGTTFTLALPTTRSRAPEARLEQPAKNGPARHFRVLLVEDHEATRHVLTRLLVRAGHEVRDAGSIAAALEIAQKYPFDLLVSDLGLPDGSGIDLMRRLREQRPIRGIVLSGFGMEEDLQATAAAGFQAHLTKPVDWERLQAALNALPGN